MLPECRLDHDLLWVEPAGTLQSDMPVFDTIQPDFDVVQLFRTNRYVGLDRLGDKAEVLVVTGTSYRAQSRHA